MGLNSSFYFCPPLLCLISLQLPLSLSVVVYSVLLTLAVLDRAAVPHVSVWQVL